MKSLIYKKWISIVQFAVWHWSICYAAEIVEVEGQTGKRLDVEFGKKEGRRISPSSGLRLLREEECKEICTNIFGEESFSPIRFCTLFSVRKYLMRRVATTYCVILNDFKLVLVEIDLIIIGSVTFVRTKRLKNKTTKR